MDKYKNLRLFKSKGEAKKEQYDAATQAACSIADVISTYNARLKKNHVSYVMRKALVTNLQTFMLSNN